MVDKIRTNKCRLQELGLVLWVRRLLACYQICREVHNLLLVDQLNPLALLLLACHFRQDRVLLLDQVIVLRALHCLRNSLRPLCWVLIKVHRLPRQLLPL